MEFLKIYVIIELQRLKANWSKWRRKCGPKKIRSVIKAWPVRVDLMVQELGFQIEHFSQ